jgi:hypothetical protein
MPTPEDPYTRRANTFSQHLVTIADSRASRASLALDVEGFELHDTPSAVRDFLDDDEVRSIYYGEPEHLLKRATGASAVHIFDHTVRIEDPSERGLARRREPVPYVYNDYTDLSDSQRLDGLLTPECAAYWARHRFAIVNVWRSIDAPVQTTPLAFADARSLERKNLLETDLVYSDRVGEIYQVSYNPNQRGHYFSDVRRDEAVLLKVYDLALDGRARLTALAAFSNPKAVANASPRNSIEVRALLSFAPH